MTQMTLVFSDTFLEPGEPRDDSCDPWDADRLALVMDAIRTAHPGLPVLEPRSATDAELELVHRPEYIQAIRDYSAGVRSRADDGYRLVGPSTTIASNTFELAALGSGAVISAVDAVLDGRCQRAAVIARPGDHHAYTARGEGFCIFNHSAVGARYAQKQRGLERILIVDWDVHHGNGTQSIFNADPTVCTLSIHGYGGIYPRSGAAEEKGSGPGRGYTINIPVEPRTGDGPFLRAFRQGLRRVPFAPDLVLLVAGFDGHRDDPVGNLRLTDAVYPELTRLVCEYAQERAGGRLVSTLAGGYNRETLGRLAASHVGALLSSA
jgi:acetoin utilization deacetylase AcuC-like enzyme